MSMMRNPRPIRRSEATQERLAWTVLLGGDAEADDGREVAEGLRQRPKRLPCRFFYDERGSQLFERICELPEYYLTRTEGALLAEIAPELVEHTGACEILELGSGSSTKTRLILDAYGEAGAPLRYAAIDVSESSLREGAASLLARYPDLEARAALGTYQQGLEALAEDRDSPVALPRLVLFLGSTIGNMTPEETERFIASLRGTLRPGDWFLVGTDLDKDPAVIEAAYNDAQGVTAAFNLNILRHINRRFRGDFALDRFAHVAVYNRALCRIEMRLRSLAAQEVMLTALDLTLRLDAGEAIETEISRKFDLGEIGAELCRHELEIAAQWTDPRRWFGLTLARAV